MLPDEIVRRHRSLKHCRGQYANNVEPYAASSKVLILGEKTVVGVVVIRKQTGR